MFPFKNGFYVQKKTQTGEQMRARIYYDSGIVYKGWFWIDVKIVNSKRLKYNNSYKNLYRKHN
jgi:hypothetical protein